MLKNVWSGLLAIMVPLYANTSIYCRAHSPLRCFVFHHLSVLMLIERLLIQRVFICRDCYMDVASWHRISTKLVVCWPSEQFQNSARTQRDATLLSRGLVYFSQTQKLLSIVIRTDEFVGHKLVSKKIQEDYFENKNWSALIRLSSFFHF